MELAQDAKEISAFTVRGGLFQWKVMPFGLCKGVKIIDTKQSNKTQNPKDKTTK